MLWDKGNHCLYFEDIHELYVHRDIKEDLLNRLQIMFGEGNITFSDKAHLKGAYITDIRNEATLNALIYPIDEVIYATGKIDKWDDNLMYVFDRATETYYYSRCCDILLIRERHSKDTTVKVNQEQLINITGKKRWNFFIKLIKE